MKDQPSVVAAKREKWKRFRMSGITIENGGIVADAAFMQLPDDVRTAIIFAATTPSWHGRLSSGDFGWAETKDVRGFWRIDEDKEGKMTMVVGCMEKGG